MKAFKESFLFYLWAALLILSVGELTAIAFTHASSASRLPATAAAAIAAPAAPTITSTTPAHLPIMDRGCTLPPSARRARLAQVQEEIDRLDRGLFASRVAFDAWERKLKALNIRYKWERRAGIALLGIGIATGAFGLYQVFILEQTVTLIGGLTLSVNASRAYMLTSGLYRVISLPRKIHQVDPHDHEVNARLVEEHQRQVHMLRTRKWFSDAATGYMSDPACTASRCSWRQPEIEGSWMIASARYQGDLKKIGAKDRWYRVDTYTHNEAKILTEVVIPWTAAITELQILQRGYAESVAYILKHDASACGTAL